MAENTKIEWATHTFNPWEGCQKVGPGCDHCYAETRNARFGGGTAINWGPGAPRRRTSAANWRKPRKWNAEAPQESCGRPRVFCASLADWADNAVLDEWRADLAALIRETPKLDWLLLTKRIGNAEAMLGAMFPEGVPGNLWLGITVVSQAEADRDIPKLLRTHGPRFRFLSIEPMLGPIDLTSIKAPREPDEPADSIDLDWRFDCLAVGDYYWFDGEDGQPGDSGDGPYRETRIDWVIAGGESGAEARPVHPDWIRSLRDQCTGASIHGDDAPVPFLFKQWGEWLSGTQYNAECLAADPSLEQSRFDCMDWDEDRFVESGGGWTDDLDENAVFRVGKKRAGRLLDGVQHDGMPA